MQHLGFVGLGMMGAPMAANLLSAGFAVTAFDLRREAMEALVARGATPATGLGDVADCDAVIVMVNTDAQAREVVTALIALLQSRPRPILCMSTILPSTIRELGEQAAAVGVDVLDAPVSGGVIVARMGALAIMVGGDPALFEEARPAFEAMGNTITHVGPLGSGLTVKLVNNTIAISTLPLVLEGLRIGLEQGLDLDTMVNVIAASSGNTWYTANWEQVRMFLQLMLDDPSQFDSLYHTGLKDMHLAQTLCEQTAIDAPVLRNTIRTLEGLGAEALQADLARVLDAAG